MDLELDSVDDKIRTAAEYWTEIARHIRDWQLARERKVSAVDLRRDYVHAHALALAALALVGKTLLAEHPADWKAKLKKLETLDWSRGNASQWEGRAMSAGRLWAALPTTGRYRSDDPAWIYESRGDRS